MSDGERVIVEVDASSIDDEDILRLDVTDLVTPIIERLDLLVEASQSLGSEVDAVVAAVQDMQSRVQARVAELESQVQADAAALAAAQGTAAESSAAIAKLEALKAEVAGIVPAATAAAGGAPTDGAPTKAGAEPTGGDAGATGAAPTAERSLYTFDGDPSVVNAVEWPRAPFTTPDGKPLFYFSGDTVPGQVNGDGVNGQWHHYTGPTVTAAAPGNAAPGSGAAGSTPGAP